jgi:hypothetical protein
VLGVPRQAYYTTVPMKCQGGVVLFCGQFLFYSIIYNNIKKNKKRKENTEYDKMRKPPYTFGGGWGLKCPDFEKCLIY